MRLLDSFMWSVTALGPGLALIAGVLLLGTCAGWLSGQMRARSRNRPCRDYRPVMKENDGARFAGECGAGMYCPACACEVPEREAGPNGEHDLNRGGCGGVLLPLLARIGGPVHLDS